MKLKSLVTINALLFIGLGIAFALYGPLMIAFFGAADLPGTESLLYWYVASFARMFGAAIFGYGFLLLALREAFDEPGPGETGRRSTLRRPILFSLILGNAAGLFVALVQQSSIWVTPAGWVWVAIFAALLLAYAFFLARSPEAEAGG